MTELWSRLALTPSGRRVATGSLDQTARVWDADSGQTLTPPLQHPWSVQQVRFCPDGRNLLTTGSAGIVWSWDLPTTDSDVTDLIRLARLLSGSRIDEHRGIMPLAAWRAQEFGLRLRQTRERFSFTFPPINVTAWHRQTTEELHRGGHWDAALWHLEQIDPSGAGQLGELRAARPSTVAEMGHWKEARHELAEVVRRAAGESRGMEPLCHAVSAQGRPRRLPPCLRRTAETISDRDERKGPNCLSDRLDGCARGEIPRYKRSD